MFLWSIPRGEKVKPSTTSRSSRPFNVLFLLVTFLFLAFNPSSVLACSPNGIRYTDFQSSNTVNLGSAGGSTALTNASIDGDCTLKVETLGQTWLHLNPSGSFTNTGISFFVDVDSNPSSAQRSGVVSVGIESFTIIQGGNPTGMLPPPGCTTNCTPGDGPPAPPQPPQGCGSATARDGNIWRLPLGTVHKGDSVNLTVTAHSSTPNANGSGMFTLVHDESGQQSYVIPVFEQYVPLHFDVQSDNQPT